MARMGSVAAHLLCTLILLDAIFLVFTSPTSSLSYLEAFGRGGAKRKCPPNNYECANGDCISGNRRCDGHSDCSGGDDEYGCNCASDEIQCLDGRCIDGNLRCNGHYNCRKGEDELHCECPDNKFKCAIDGSCIPLSWKCNGIPNCRDGTDEGNCQDFLNIQRSEYEDEVLIETLQEALKSYLESIQAVRAQAHVYED